MSFESFDNNVKKTNDNIDSIDQSGRRNLNVFRCITIEYMKVLTLRVPEDVLEKINEIAKREGKERSEVIRELLKIGLRDKLIEDALKAYKEGKISMWKAAKTAGLSLWEFIEILKEKGVEIQYGLRELEEDLS